MKLSSYEKDQIENFKEKLVTQLKTNQGKILKDELYTMLVKN